MTDVSGNYALRDEYHFAMSGIHRLAACPIGSKTLEFFGAMVLFGFFGHSPTRREPANSRRSYANAKLFDT